MAHDFLNEAVPVSNTALVREVVVARRWGKSVRTLQRWRCQGTGPVCIRIGNSIFYRSTDILAFEAAHQLGEVRT